MEENRKERSYHEYGGNENTNKKNEESGNHKDEKDDKKVPNQPLANINNGEYQRR